MSTKNMNIALKDWYSDLKKNGHTTLPNQWPIVSEDFIEFGNRSEAEKKRWKIDEEEWLVLEERRFLICALMCGKSIP